MRELKTEIQISSTPDKVWNILMDLPNWPKWNPVVKKIKGDLKVGATLTITMSDDKGNEGKTYKSVVTDIDKERRFSFVGTMMAKFIFSVERIIELEASNGGTHFFQREIYSGFMAPLFWKKIHGPASSILNSMNKGLKKEAEN